MQDDFSGSFNRVKSDNSLNLVGGGLLGNSGRAGGESASRYFECMTPVEDSSMGESPIFQQSFGKRKNGNYLAVQFQASMSSQSDIPNHKLFG